MGANQLPVRLLYGTGPGRLLLRVILRTGADRLAVGFLRSPLSKPMIRRYVRRYQIPPEELAGQSFRTFHDFFIRRRETSFDPLPDHLISPCDGWLSAVPVRANSRFRVKGFDYSLEDLTGGGVDGSRYANGTCLIFRLASSDYHHFCCIDDGFCGACHRIPGALHSVQPAACERYPVYTLNRRAWTLLDTDHFGPVLQSEVGALVVGGIVHEREESQVRKGEAMGRFELAGSTIVQFFEAGRIRLNPEVLETLDSGAEHRVRLGMWIGTGGS